MHQMGKNMGSHGEKLHPCRCFLRILRQILRLLKLVCLCLKNSDETWKTCGHWDQLVPSAPAKAFFLWMIYVYITILTYCIWYNVIYTCILIFAFKCTYTHILMLIYIYIYINLYIHLVWCYGVTAWRIKGSKVVTKGRVLLGISLNEAKQCWDVQRIFELQRWFMILHHIISHVDVWSCIWCVTFNQLEPNITVTTSDLGLQIEVELNPIREEAPARLLRTSRYLVW